MFKIYARATSSIFSWCFQHYFLFFLVIELIASVSTTPLTLSILSFYYSLPFISISNPSVSSFQSIFSPLFSSSSLRIFHQLHRSQWASSLPNIPIFLDFFSPFPKHFLISIQVPLISFQLPFIIWFISQLFFYQLLTNQHLRISFDKSASIFNKILFM